LRSSPDPEIKTSGSGVRGGKSYSWSLEERIPDTVSLRPGEEYFATISFDLPPGDYDFLVGYGGGVHESESLVSNLVAFDVDQDGNGTLVETRGR